VQKLIFFLVLCIFLISPLITYASDYGDGMKAMKNGNHEKAVKFFRIAAEKGDSRAQHCLGVMLNKGQGVEQNYEESFKWLNLAAKQGFSQAKLDLAILFYYKQGIPENFSDAVMEMNSFPVMMHRNKPSRILDR
jgi:TPR repeat protein